MTDVAEYLKQYDGPPVKIMEVCGTHTAQISRCGIRSLLSPVIRLISGPGCPVCVTVTEYIDRLIALSKEKNTEVVTFGDLLRVPGSAGSLRDGKADGGAVRMVYSPMDALTLAEQMPEREFVFAAVGFETTAPVYAMLLERMAEKKVKNLRLLTSLKTMPQAIDQVCRNQRDIDGFLAPGHVSVVTGSGIFKPLAERYHIPFAVSGFEGEEILAAVYALVKGRGRGWVKNLYPSAVTEEGNKTAVQAVEKYFKPCGAAWRGMGLIEDSGLILREKYSCYDAGSGGLLEDKEFNRACRCAGVLTGSVTPEECPLFASVCTPETPQGACMVSTEGSCFYHFTEKGRGAV